jgi:hypothetical protein
MRFTAHRSTAAVFSLVVLMCAPAASAQDPLMAARDLYSAAAYEDALAVLDRVDPSTDRFGVNQYRAFCLLALGRTNDAERAIEAIVTARPLYQPSEAEASPRLRSAFTQVRQRMLPSIVQQKYVVAKAAFDLKDFPTALSGFNQVIETLADPDLKGAASKPPLSDLATLAIGFRDLSAKSIPSSPPPEPVVAATAAPPPAPAMPVASRIYNRGEVSITSPVTIRQDLPAFPRNIGPMTDGVMEIVISEAGLVESATMKASTNPRYDSLAIAATKSWRYKPAMMGKTPVKFRKQISISLKPGD